MSGLTTLEKLVIVCALHCECFQLNSMYHIGQFDYILLLGMYPNSGPQNHH